MPNIVNDGSVSYGSRDLVIDGITYATDDFTLTGSKKEIQRTNQLDIVTGMVTIPDLDRGTATLQLADETTAVPEAGDTFTEDSIVYVVQTIGRAETKGGETKVPIEFYRRITTDLVVTAV